MSNSILIIHVNLLLSHREMKKKVAFVLFVFVSACFVHMSHVRLISYRNAIDNLEKSPLYLPNVNYVRLVTLGYNTLVSDLLWFDTLNYFGKQLTTNKDYQWLDHMCKLVTSLDSKALHVYEFCSTFLSWFAHQSKLSTKLLTDGINANPNYWRLYYLRGFNYWYFEEDFDLAREDFVSASKFPDSPDFLANLAARLLVKTKSPDSAMQFLDEMEKRTNNESIKTALSAKRKEAVIAQHIDFLREALRRYKNKNSRSPQTLDELISAKIITSIPNEPFGGDYRLDENGEPFSSSGHRGLDFRGNVAKNTSGL